MKPSTIIAFLLCCTSALLSAQTPSGTSVGTPNPTFGKEVVTTIDKNLELKDEMRPKDGPCSPFRYLPQFDLKQLVPDAKKFDVFIDNFDLSYNKRLQRLQHQITVPQNTSLNEFAVTKLATAIDLADFVLQLTGSDLEQLSEQDQSILLDFFLNHPIKKNPSVTVKGKKFVKAKMLPCYASSSTELKLIGWKSYPKLTWQLNTTIHILCDCKEQGPGDLSQGSIVFKALVQSIYNTNKVQFQKARLLGPFGSNQSCCGLEEDTVEEDREPAGPVNEYIPPKQTLGGSAGIGFSQDFDETNYCIGLEYLYKVTELVNSPLYAGAYASYGGFSFNGNNSSLMQLGLSVQLFSQFSEYLNRVQITNGILASYLIGSQDFNGQKDNSTGYSVTLHTGLNLPINENVAVSLFIPVVSHQNLTFSNDSTGDFSVSETTLLINKNNPVRIGLRFRL